MQIFHKKNLYLPALSIIVVVAILLLVIGVSTYQNLDRGKQRVLSFAHRQGTMLLRTLEASVRSDLMMDRYQEDLLATTIREVAKDNDIAYLYLADKAGNIIHHSEPNREIMRSTWNAEIFEAGWVHSRRAEMTDGTPIYEMAKLFHPVESSTTGSKPDVNLAPHSDMAFHLHKGDIIVLGLKLTAYESAQQSDLHHAIIMAVILLALGSGVLFFVFVIQNYYLVKQALRKTQDYTQQIISSMANGLVGIDAKGNVLTYNPVALQLLGLEAQKMEKVDLKSIIDFSSSGIRETLDKQRTVLNRKIDYTKPNGEKVLVDISISPVLDAGGVCTGAVLVLRDLREIRQLEEKVRRSEKLAAIGKLAAGVAHEIRNPLSSIRGFAQFLQHSLTDKPQDHEYAEVMIKEIDRINRVVSDLLSFASPKAADLRPTNVAELVEHVIRLIEVDARSKNIEIHSSISSGLDEIPLDAYQITQALLNLILNALKLMSSGHIHVTAMLDEDLSTLMLRVEDDGPGVPPENMEKIFDPFFTTRETGTGLGLSIVHKIAEYHNGDILVESPPPGKNCGSCFTMSIPVNPQ